ncbi:hypothetical protein HFO93_19910 [Rhizobium leguminosarum]|uniref:methyl-accepting chemotaxis protein n=1 Tax=Rhizobium leguminosarum TaxID=384 RepID=UPI001DCFBB7C|nr:methyl-accepting chemotaxis protein [Rhizobium leguminosarum]MBY5445705.1 hypothetical protein [Rhizobium leguminosarum]
MAESRSILCFGDSLTWGWIPVPESSPTLRYPFEQRWTGAMAAALGDGYSIIEEGLSARTTSVEDPNDPRLNGSAYRSAQAAKEINALIHNSSGEVESGVKLVRDTGETLNTIGDFIRQIHAHVEVISTSAREQSTGLLEVNSAVNSMDQTTQQNAAMVEEATAAAASLAQEAQTLRELVSNFKLEGGPSLQPSALRMAANRMARSTRPNAASAPQSRLVKLTVGGDRSQSWEEF